MSGWWQRLRAGNENLIIQATGNVSVGNNLTYTEVKDISETVARYEIERYASTAKETLWQRIEEFVVNYFNRQTTLAPEALESLKDPFMQRALRTAQIEYGASGKSDVGESLADLLVDLSQANFGSTESILLNEALSIVPKLTKSHLSALTAVLILKLTVMNTFKSRNELCGFLSRNIVPLEPLLPKNTAAYRHLQFTQTGWIQSFSPTLAAALQESYGGILSEGFYKGDIPEQIADFYPNFFVDHERYNGRVRLIAPNANTLDVHIASNSRLPPWSQWLHEKLTSTRTEPSEIEVQLAAEVAGMGLIFAAGNGTDLDSFQLTSVGTVIAHANWKGMNTGDALPLSVYLKDYAED